MPADISDRIQSAWGAWLSAHGFEARAAQRHMIEHLSAALLPLTEGGEATPVAIEAPTGTGKTAAYLAVAIPVAMDADRKLIIATSTVTLQKQILDRELPSLRDCGALDFDYALAKGRRRYLCQLRLNRALARDAGQDALDLGEEAAPPDAKALKLYRRMGKAVRDGRWSGDIDDWSEALDASTRRRITASGAQCIGAKCRWYESGCAYYEAKRQVWKADVVVANHDMVLSDLQLGGGAVLPAPEQAIYVFDEAHRLGDKACAHAAVDGRSRRDQEWLDGAGKALGGLVAGDGRRAAKLETLLADLRRELARLDGALKGLSPNDAAADRIAEEGVMRFSLGKAPLTLREAAADLTLAYERWLDFARALRAAEENDSEYGDEEAAARCAQLGAQCDFVEDRLRLWRSLSVAEDSHTAPRARWLKVLADGDCHVHTQPVQATELLAELWARAAGVALCSATLRMADDDFKRFKEQIGFPASGACHAIASSFDHGKVELHIPDLGCEPNQVEAHTRAVAEYLRGALPQVDGGSLILFASARQMHDTRRLLGEELPVQTLWQRERSNKELIQAHRDKIDRGGASALFGLASFAEGLDLPGDYCRLVVICKLFFAPPGDPVVATLGEWWEQSQEGDAFADIAVPETALRLVQACGRLLRGEDDGGRIALLDSRVRSKRYGRRMLASLPPYRITH